MAEAGFSLEGEPTMLYEQYLLVFKKANVESKKTESHLAT
jgi:hypothetical protein